jgi:hypothetical protein
MSGPASVNIVFDWFEEMLENVLRSAAMESRRILKAATSFWRLEALVHEEIKRWQALCDALE